MSLSVYDSFTSVGGLMVGVLMPTLISAFSEVWFSVFDTASTAYTWLPGNLSERSVKVVACRFSARYTLYASVGAAFLSPTLFESSISSMAQAKKSPVSGLSRSLTPWKATIGSPLEASPRYTFTFWKPFWLTMSVVASQRISQVAPSSWLTFT